MAGGREPVIASSDRSKDYSVFCARLYRDEEHKCRDIFPWEFPQAASQEVEEAFLREWFGERDTHLWGYPFLKQVFYGIAIWNFHQKLPLIVDWWLQKNETMWSDTSLFDSIMHPEAKHTTFFEREQMETWGEKMLQETVPLIQAKVQELTVRRDETRQRSQSVAADPVQQTIAANEAAIKANGGLLGSNGTKSAVISKVSPALIPTDKEFVPQMPPTASFVPAVPQPPKPDTQPIRRGRDESSSGYVAPIQGRKHGNSYSRAHPNRNPPMAPRYDNQNQRGQVNPYYSTQHQSSPAFNSSGFDGVQPHPMHTQMRGPSGGAQSYMPSPHQNHQQMHGMPPPPGLYGSAQHQQYGMQYPANQMNEQYQANGFLPPGHQQQPFDPAFGGMPADQNGQRFREQSYSNGYEGDFGHDGGRPRRESNVSRGRGRGGKASRGRNSFHEPRGKHFGDGFGEIQGRRPSQEFNNFRSEQQGFGNKGRRNSVADKNWRQNERSQPQTENMQPVRMFSEPSAYMPGPPPKQMLPENGPPTSNPRSNSLWKSIQPAGLRGEMNRRPSTHQSQAASQSLPHNQHRQSSQHQHPQSATLDGHPMLHSHEDPRCTEGKEYLVCKDFIGAKCVHVTKVIVFQMPEHITLSDLEVQLQQFGPVSRMSELSAKNDPSKRDVFVRFSNRESAQRALLANNKQIDLGLIHVEVPKEYWDVEHPRYPGEGHPEFQSSNSYPHSTTHVFSSSGAKEFKNPFVPIGRPDAPHSDIPLPVKEAVEPAVREALSGSTTPTASSTTTPKKKNNKKNNRNKKALALREDALQAATQLAEKLQSEDAVAGAHSEVPVVPAVQSEQAVSSDQHDAPSAAIEAGSEPLKVDTNVSEGSDGVMQTKPEPSFSPEESRTRLPNAPASTNELATDVADNATTVKQLSFRETIAPSKAEAAIPEKPSDMSTQPTVSPTQPVSSNKKAVASNERSTGKSKRTSSRQSGEVLQKADEEQVDDSFYTATGTPDSQKRSKGKEDQGTDESYVTVKAEPQTTPAKSGTTATTKTHSTSPTVEATKSVASPSAATSKTQVPVPQLPQIKIVAEPPVRRTSNASKLSDGSPRAQSVPPTPAFATAPTTPAVTDDTTPTDGKTVKNTSDEPTGPQPTTKPAVLPAKVEKIKEKIKGPAQTESLSLFGKAAKPKSKKPKKVKGSIRGKPKFDDDAVSDVATGSTSRVVSGVASPLAEETFSPRNSKMDSIDEVIAAQGSRSSTPRKKPTSARKDVLAEPDMQVEQQAGPSQQLHGTSPRRSTLSFLGNSLGSLFGGKGDASPAPTPEPKSRETTSEPKVTEADRKRSGSQVATDQTTEKISKTGSSSDETQKTDSSSDDKAYTDTVPPTGNSKPFRFFPESVDAAGVVDSGDSGGTTRDDDSASSSPATSGDAGPGMNNKTGTKKKKKKRSQNKKRAEEEKKVGEPVDEGKGSPSGLPGAKGTAPFLFTANKGGSHPEAGSQAKVQTVSESGSEASSQTTGRAESPSSVMAMAAAAPSPSSAPTKRQKDLENMIQQQNGGGLIVGPTRPGPLGARLVKKRPASSSATNKSAGSEEAGESDGGLSSTPSSGQGSENQFDEVVGRAMRDSSSGRMLYLYVGVPEGSQTVARQAGSEERTVREMKEGLGEREQLCAQIAEGAQKQMEVEAGIKKDGDGKEDGAKQ